MKAAQRLCVLILVVAAASEKCLEHVAVALWSPQSADQHRCVTASDHWSEAQQLFGMTERVKFLQAPLEGSPMAIDLLGSNQPLLAQLRERGGGISIHLHEQAFFVDVEAGAHVCVALTSLCQIRPRFPQSVATAIR